MTGSVKKSDCHTAIYLDIETQKTGKQLSFILAILWCNTRLCLTSWLSWHCSFLCKCDTITRLNEFPKLQWVLLHKCLSPLDSKKKLWEVLVKCFYNCYQMLFNKGNISWSHINARWLHSFVINLILETP